MISSPDDSTRAAIVCEILDRRRYNLVGLPSAPTRDHAQELHR